jgi:hypothetical protein
MRGRSRAGSKLANARSRKTATPKGANAPKLGSRRSSSPTHPETQVAHITRELQESLAREDATSEVLRVIASSPNDTQPVFNTIVTSATRCTS